MSWPNVVVILGCVWAFVALVGMLCVTSVLTTKYKYPEV